MSDLLVFVQVLGKQSEMNLDPFLKELRIKLGDRHKLCLFHFNYCHFKKGPFY